MLQPAHARLFVLGVFLLAVVSFLLPVLPGMRGSGLAYAQQLSLDERIEYLTEKMVDIDENIDDARWFGERFLNEGRTKDLVDTARQRAGALLHAAQTNPDAAYDKATLAAADFPEDVQIYIEKPIRASGILFFPDAHKSEEESGADAFIIVDGEPPKAVYGVDNPIDAPQMNADIEGITIATGIIPKRNGVYTTQLLEPRFPTPRTYRLLAVYVDYVNSPQLRGKPEDLAWRLNPGGPVADWFNEVSYGNMQLQTTLLTVHSPLRIETDLPIDEQLCFEYSALNDIWDTLELAKYDGIMLMDNQLCGAGGWGVLGPMDTEGIGPFRMSRVRTVGDSFENDPSDSEWLYWDYVVAHELGHTLGFWHANAYICPPDTIAGPDCWTQEYGNYIDVMGVSRSGGFSAHFRRRAEWLPESDVTLVDASGTYELRTVEGSTGTRMLVIPSKLAGDLSAPTYVEYRVKSPHAKQLPPGLAINIESKRYRDSSSTRVLDLDPSPESQLLREGIHHVDPARGYEVSFVSTADGTASVTVNLQTTNTKSASLVLTNLRYALDYDKYDYENSYFPWMATSDLEWTSPPLFDCTLDEVPVAPAGQQRVTVHEETTFTLFCISSETSFTRTATVLPPNRTMILQNPRMEVLEGILLLNAGLAESDSCTVHVLDTDKPGKSRDVSFEASQLPVPIYGVVYPNPVFDVAVPIEGTCYRLGQEEAISLTIPRILQITTFSLLAPNVYNPNAVIVAIASSTVPARCTVTYTVGEEKTEFEAEYLMTYYSIPAFRTADSTFTYTCTSNDGTLTDTDTLAIPANPLIVSYTLEQLSPADYTLRWDAPEAQNCTLTETENSGLTETVPTTGQKAVHTTRTAAYTLTCIKGEYSEQQTIPVNGMCVGDYCSAPVVRAPVPTIDETGDEEEDGIGTPSTEDEPMY